MGPIMPAKVANVSQAVKFVLTRVQLRPLDAQAFLGSKKLTGGWITARIGTIGAHWR